MKALPVCLGFLALLALPSPTLEGQAPVPALQLGPREFTTRDGQIELFRVRDGAAIGRNVAILDAGNSRVLILDPEGRALRQFGGSGDAPGEFRSMTAMWVTNGSIAVYDGALARLSIFDFDGELQETIAVPPYEERMVTVAGVSGNGTYLGISYAASTLAEARRPGVITQSASLLRLRGSTWVPFATVPWQRNYVHVVENGSTSYNPGFMGRGIITADSVIAIWQLDSGSVEVTAGRTQPAVTTLPVIRRQVPRRMIEQYRDSILEIAERSAATFPFAVQQIRDIFDDDFVVDNLVPTVSDLQIAGGDVWARSYPETDSDSVDWFVLKGEDADVFGRLSLPRTTRVLGGDRDRVFVVEVDPLGVESVSAYLKPIPR